ncbi:MAG: hypothetical protein KAR42_11090 [candidate division Zixibacteria bacterium]|nr:hypothetical protein [candidate division Zixibacteria bacterium]
MGKKSTQTELLKKAFYEQMKGVGTSIPGHVVAFDKDKQLAQLQIGINRTRINGDVYDPEVLIECKPQFAGGNAFIIEHQIDVGDECIIMFSQRCIDGWMNTGGIANNPILRFHDVNDAYFIPGLRSQPNVVIGFDNNGVKIRNKAGDQFIWLKNDSTAVITVPTLHINGDIVHVGSTTSTGTINSDTSLTSPSVVADGKELKDHDHSPGSYVAGPTPVLGNSGANN